MSEQSASPGLRERLASQTEDALGKLAQDLLENPLVNGALARAFGAREKATQAQEVAMGALNLPSAADVERLTRRLRSVSQRLEGIEDGVDRVDRALSRLSGDHSVEARLSGMEEQLAGLTRMIADLREGLPGASAPVPLAQERLEVDAAGAAEHQPAVEAPRPRAKRAGKPRRDAPRRAPKA
jgi:CRP-like cAMP-binding protein